MTIKAPTFDLRVEAYKNSTLMASGQTLCITGVTKKRYSAKEVVLGFDPFSPASFNGTSEVLKLKVLTRVGTHSGGRLLRRTQQTRLDCVCILMPFLGPRGSRRQQGFIDTTPPVLTVAQPADNSITSTTQISVTGTFSDQSQTTITVNGIGAALQGNSFNATVPLSEGQNNLLVVATDASGNTD